MKRGLIGCGTLLRTTSNKDIDEFYQVDEKGRLVGRTDAFPYSAPEKRPFEPEKILQGQRISDGWFIEPESFKFDILYPEVARKYPKKV